LPTIVNPAVNGGPTSLKVVELQRDPTAWSESLHEVDLAGDDGGLLSGDTEKVTAAPFGAGQYPRGASSWAAQSRAIGDNRTNRATSKLLRTPNPLPGTRGEHRMVDTRSEVEAYWREWPVVTRNRGIETSMDSSSAVVISDRGDRHNRTNPPSPE
jgi:hypothetical protein